MEVTKLDMTQFIQTNSYYFDDFIARATYHSNAIENNSLSFRETKALLFNEPLKITATPHEFYEVINHKHALLYTLYEMSSLLTKEDIINIAASINKGVHHVYGYRQTDVFISGSKHIPPTYRDVDRQMMYCIFDFNDNTSNHLFENIAKHHLMFERIHPFIDGNGRTGRILIIYECLKHNVAPAIITQDYKADYFHYLNTQDVSRLAKLLEQLSILEAEHMQKFDN